MAKGRLGFHRDWSIDDRFGELQRDSEDWLLLAQRISAQAMVRFTPSASGDFAPHPVNWSSEIRRKKYECPVFPLPCGIKI